MAGVGGDLASASDEDTLGIGGGGQLYAGLERALGQVTLISEFVVSHHVLSAEAGDDVTVTAAKFGGKLRFLKDFEPGLFVHIGGGRIAGNADFATTDLAFDAGLLFDVTLLPLVDVGAHLAWNQVFGGPAAGLSYATAGLHLALVVKDTL